MSKAPAPRTESLRTYPEDADTPPPVSAHDHEPEHAVRAHAPVHEPAPPSPSVNAEHVAAAKDGTMSNVLPKSGKEVPPPFRFDPDGKAYARAENGTMVQVKLEAAQLAVNDAHAQASHEVMLKAAASCAAQHAVAANP